MCDLCAKWFFDYEFNLADIDKISNFNEIASNFTYSWTSKIFKYNWTDHLLLKSKFYGRGKSGMYFFHFWQLPALKLCSLYEDQSFVCLFVCLLHLTEKIFWPSLVSRTYETVSEILLIASYSFSSNATVGKNGSERNWYLLLVIHFNANGDPPLETMRAANSASSDSHL